VGLFFEVLPSAVVQASELAVERGTTIVLSGVPTAPTGLKADFTVVPVGEIHNDGRGGLGYITVLKPAVQLVWNSAADNTQYVVYRNTVNSFADLTAVTTTLPGVTSYLDLSVSSITVTTTFYYKVAGKNERGEGYNSDVAIVTVFPSQGSVPGEQRETGGRVSTQEGSGLPSGTAILGSARNSWINFDKLPSQNVALPAGSRINFDYSWTNKLPKGKIKSINRKFIVRRRLWNTSKEMVLEKSAVITVNPGQSQKITVNEFLKQGRLALPEGAYTMEVEILHYTPYRDEADLVVDKNWFNLMVSP
jgi:hypothetical protein